MMPNNQPAFTVVLAQMVSITLVSSIILIAFYRRYERWMLDFVSWVTGSNRHLALFTLTILVVPVALLLA